MGTCHHIFSKKIFRNTLNMNTINNQDTRKGGPRTRGDYDDDHHHHLSENNVRNGGILLVGGVVG